MCVGVLSLCQSRAVRGSRGTEMGVPPALCAPQRGYGREQPQGCRASPHLPAVPTARLRIPLICKELVSFLVTQGWVDEALALQGSGTCTWPRYLQTRALPQPRRYGGHKVTEHPQHLLGSRCYKCGAGSSAWMQGVLGAQRCVRDFEITSAISHGGVIKARQVCRGSGVQRWRGHPV